MTSLNADQAELLRLRRLRTRLKRATTKLEEFAHRLEALHADRSGAFRMMYPGVPLIPSEWHVVERSVRRNTVDAAKGCQLCVLWLKQTAELRTRIDKLRNTRLPEKAPDYSGPWILPNAAIRAGKHRSLGRYHKTPEQRRQLVSDYMDRVIGRNQPRCVPER